MVSSLFLSEDHELIVLLINTLQKVCVILNLTCSMLRTFCVWVEYFNQPEKKIKSKRVHAGKDLKEVNFEINVAFLVITVHVHVQQLADRLLGELFFTFTFSQTTPCSLILIPGYIPCTFETNMAAHWGKHLISTFLPKNLGQCVKE